MLLLDKVDQVAILLRRTGHAGGHGGRESTEDAHREIDHMRPELLHGLPFAAPADLLLVALPKLLLGRLPAEPAANLKRSEERVSFLDARGQLWSGSLNGDELEWWSLVEAEEAVVWWRREARGGVFADRDGEQEVRWEEMVREPLESPLDALEIPAKYRQGECGGAAPR